MMTMPGTASAHVPAAHLSAHGPLRRTRPIYWSVRRELWENRWLYIAPVSIAAFTLLVFVASALRQPTRVAESLTVRAADSLSALADSGLGGPMVIMMATLIIGVFYSLEALQSERRDRSILFWKSLPVSDAATILAKALIPLVVLPVLTCLLIVVTQLAMLVLGTGVLLLTGSDAGAAWAAFPFLLWPVMVYFIIALTLWHAPIYAALLLISAWARRAPFLWAILPLLVLTVVERHTLYTSYVTQFLTYRSLGFFSEAFALSARADQGAERVPFLTPGNFLSSPGLWLGLLFAAGCLVAAIRLRRERDPA
jgi:ABC-2 type transport system permease protein